MGLLEQLHTMKIQCNPTFSNSINVGLDTTPPTFGDVRGLQDKYYRGDNVNISIPVSDNAYGSGVEDASITENSGLQAVFNRDTSWRRRYFSDYWNDF